MTKNPYWQIAAAVLLFSWFSFAMPSLMADPLTSQPAAPIVPWPARPELEAEFIHDLGTKQAAIEKLRAQLVANPPDVLPEANDLKTVRGYLQHLDDSGTFNDIESLKTNQWTTALSRLSATSAAFKRLTVAEQSSCREKMLRSILIYCKQALAHPDSFTGSAFGAPKNAAAIYFSFYDQLQSNDATEAVSALKDCVFMCWYWPIYNHDQRRKTDPHHLDVFLGEGHFTVGNLTYRPIVECAVMHADTKMMDVIHAIIERSLANQTAYQIENDSLWGQQGLTMDGNGFAHGRQSYLFGYVSDWFNGVCRISRLVRGTPWEISPDSWNLAANMILDGQQWYMYRGDVDWSVNGRHNMDPGPIGPGSKGLVAYINQVLELSHGHVSRNAELLARIIH